MALNKTELNLEFLKLALQIEESQTQQKVIYVDVGDLPKQKAQDYVKNLMAAHKNDGIKTHWLERKEGGTSVQVLPGGATIEGVLATAEKLKQCALR